MPCFDTTVLIDLRRPPRRPERQRAAAAVQRFARAGERLTTTRVCEAEFRVGIHLSPDPAYERAAVERLLSGFQVLDLDAAAAEHFGAIKAHLYRIGRPAGDMDVLIASIALANAQSLVIRNPRHFADVPGLVIEPY